MATKNVLSPNTVARVPTSEERRLLRRVGNEITMPMKRKLLWEVQAASSEIESQ
ncbi:hypothetical protein GN244_ATG10730 [Phytophthora infestans]|uniref:Uncharacterized protein n=1 Tax=Phytophthora infestans TaxID=4787 RepID=A0A833WCG1_PHYIN|nr:hypothetical protein GN244_ATG10730 [Phytophthora infestans]